MLLLCADVCNIYTREAGPGNLSVAVEGPGKADISIEERPNGFLGIAYKVPKPGTIKGNECCLDLIWPEVDGIPHNSICL